MNLFQSLIVVFSSLCFLAGISIPSSSAVDASEPAAKTAEMDKIKQLTAQIKAEPKKALLYAKRGQCYVRVKDWDNALSDTNEALKLGPSIGLFYLARGSIYKEMGKHDLEKLDLEHAVQLSPDDVQCLKKLAALYSMNNNDSDACKLLSKAISIKSNSAELYLLRAETFNSMRNFPEALADCDQAEKFAPGDKEIAIVRNEINKREINKGLQR